ncbi:venom protein 302-like [Limulus polyphemus]|uniref:Venom protein 302-like n=1 Tax=Limulus polyphemus TaxID=6850 RepID=A0ABM1SJC7_LIMPO|nr:venom protein 302-like [Limulus polyphemus]
MEKRFLTFAATLLLLIIGRRAWTLSCLQCDKSTCKNHSKNCSVGFTDDACGCCKVCAKAEGEPCGGEWNKEGFCGSRLTCVHEIPDNEDPEWFKLNNPGTCRPVAGKGDQT